MAIAAGFIMPVFSCANEETGPLTPDATVGDIENTNPDSGNESHVSVAQLSVMSFNVRTQKLDDDDYPMQKWDARKTAVSEMINDVRPDIIGFQETVMKDQVNDLRKLLGADYSWDGYDPATDHSVFEALNPTMVNAVFYRTSLFKKLDDGIRYYTDDGSYGDTVWPGVDSRYRSFRWLKLGYVPSLHREAGKDMYGRVVWVFNTHFPVAEADGDGLDQTVVDAQTKCMERLMGKVRELCGEDDVVLVTGDFNCGYNHEQSLATLNVADSWLSHARNVAKDKDNKLSQNSWKNHSNYGIGSIDHIFFKNVEPVRYRTVDAPYDGLEFISDHFPINFTFRMDWEMPVVETFETSLENFGTEMTVEF